MKTEVHTDPVNADDKLAPCVEGVPLSRLVAYFLRLGTVGFGGPIALAGYMQRERSTLEAIAQARSTYSKAVTVHQKADASGPLASSVRQ